LEFEGAAVGEDGSGGFSGSESGGGEWDGDDDSACVFDTPRAGTVALCAGEVEGAGTGEVDWRGAAGGGVVDVGVDCERVVGVGD